jgi:hypothetical protein
MQSTVKPRIWTHGLNQSLQNFGGTLLGCIIIARNFLFVFNERNQQLYSLEKNQTQSSYNSRETDHQLFDNFDLTPVLVSEVLRYVM